MLQRPAGEPVVQLDRGGLVGRLHRDGERQLGRPVDADCRPAHAAGQDGAGAAAQLLGQRWEHLLEAAPRLRGGQQEELARVIARGGERFFQLRPGDRLDAALPHARRLDAEDHAAAERLRVGVAAQVGLAK